MKRRGTYNLVHLASSIFMMLALLWLTVSVAFIVPSQQHLAKQDKVFNAESAGTTEDDSSNPFGNTNEEKASNTNTFSEEYLHDHHSSDHFISIVTRIHNSRNCGTYNAFHGEVHVPPPNIA